MIRVSNPRRRLNNLDVLLKRIQRNARRSEGCNNGSAVIPTRYGARTGPVTNDIVGRCVSRKVAEHKRWIELSQRDWRILLAHGRSSCTIISKSFPTSEHTYQAILSPAAISCARELIVKLRLTYSLPSCVKRVYPENNSSFPYQLRLFHFQLLVKRPCSIFQLRFTGRGGIRL